MSTKDPEFLKRLLATFKVEAEEHVRAITSGLVELEAASSIERQKELVELVFREAHSLKGASRAVNMTEVEALCQSLESVFSALKREEAGLSPALFDALHAAVDILDRLVLAAGGESAAAGRVKRLEVVAGLESALKGAGRMSPEGSKQARQGTGTFASQPASDLPVENAGTLLPFSEIKPVPTDTIRIPATKLKSLLVQAEEMVSVKLALGQRVAGLNEILGALSSLEKDRAKVHPQMRTIQLALAGKGKGNENGSVHLQNGNGKATSAAVKLIEFLETNESTLELQKNKLVILTRFAEQDYRTLSSMVDTLLADIREGQCVNERD